METRRGRLANGLNMTLIENPSEKNKAEAEAAAEAVASAGKCWQKKELERLVMEWLK